jgi:hypothetical protein
MQSPLDTASRTERNCSQSETVYLWPKILRNLQRPGRIFDQELLFDCFIEDGLEIRATLLHAILAVNFCQMVYVRLQLELVD